MKKFILLIFTVTLLQACVDPDTEAPVIQLNSISPAVGQGTVCGEIDDRVIEVNSGNTISAVLVLSDNVELSQYKVDLHSNFDCHGHAKPLSDTEDWYVIDIENVSGKTAETDLELTPPTNVTSGTYHFEIQATDAAGNQAESILYSVNVINTSDTESPILTVSNPAVTNLTVSNNDPISFEGNLTDNEPLNEGGNSLIEVRYWNTNNQTINTLAERSLSDINSETFDFSFDEQIPQTLVSGNYIFEVRAFDGVNNPSNTVEFSVTVN